MNMNEGNRDDLERMFKRVWRWGGKRRDMWSVVGRFGDVSGMNGNRGCWVFRKEGVGK